MDSRVTILYGSQTGNAEDMAKRVGLQAKSLGYPVLVQAMDDFPLKQLPKQRLVIFICSTTGHGQEPENMSNLFNFMRRKGLPRDCLAPLKFAVYGLGDSSYTKFNYVSKILFKRLSECGAKALQPLVAGDEQHQFGCDGVIYPKLEELWQAIGRESLLSPEDCDKFVSKPQNTTIDSQCFSYSVLLFTSTNGGSIASGCQPFSREFKASCNMQEAICMVNQRITAPDHFQDTRFLRFRACESDSLSHEPGDVCTILPENSDESVQEFMSLLGLNPTDRITLKKLDPNYMVNYLYDFVPAGLQVQDLVRYYLDIGSVPKRSFFEFLWPFSEADSLERGKLKEFASTEGQEELYDYCIRPKRTILETLMDFPQTVKNIRLDSLLDMIPPIKPRSFSIASARSAYPDEIQLIVGVVNYRTSMRKMRKGLCSNYLARMKTTSDGISSGSVLRYFVRRTSFKLPREVAVPIIMVGPGLGVAPFRSFIEERHARLQGTRHALSNNHLYFGCRSPDKDYYFKDELEGFAAKDQMGAATLNLKVAFSRHEPKQHVQDLLLADAEAISRLINDESAIFYVAGNSRLPPELRTLLAKVLTRERGDSSAAVEQTSVGDEGERLVAQLEAANRIQYDCW